MLRKIRQVILILGDGLAAYLSLVLTVLIGFWGKFSWQVFYLHIYPFTILYLSWLVVFYIFDLYNLNLSRDKFFFYPRLAEALLTNLLVGVAFFYLWPALGITPKTNLILNIIFFGLFILLWRKIFYKLFSKRLLTNVAILGKSKEAAGLAKEISGRPYLGYKLTEGKTEKVDLLIAGEELKENSIITEKFYTAMTSGVKLLELPEAYEAVCRKIPISFVNKPWILHNLKNGQKLFQNKLKRLFDLIFSCLLLAVSSPLWLIIALAIKLEDKGKIFYKQKRLGKNKKPFYLIKFRSMKEGAEKKEAKWAEKNDPRITKTGRFLRRSHLDELPQALNVLKGEISMVGPRPERPEFVKRLEKQIPYYNLRHLIKPGLTGWDQIKFKYARTVLDSYEKFEYDLYYLKNRNLLLDLGILLKTFQSFFRKTE